MEYPKFKVCCRCFTFNHSKYITDAMNGFTMQQTSFPFVCCIVDDASTDREQDVIRKYVEENFDFSEGSVAFHKETAYSHITYAQHKTNKNCYFAVLYLKENHYSQRKPKMGYLSEWRDMCEYEALCEGDDYWIDPLKLQKQVSYLDQNPECGLVYAKAKVYDQAAGLMRKNSIGNDVSKLEQLIIKNNICTLTTCLRINCLEGYNKDAEITRERKQWKMGDYPMWLWIVGNYHACFMDREVAVYRMLQESLSHSSNLAKNLTFAQSIYEIRMFYIKRFNISNSVINEVKNDLTGRITFSYLSSHKYFKAICHLIKLPIKSALSVVADYLIHEVKKVR